MTLIREPMTMIREPMPIIRNSSTARAFNRRPRPPSHGMGGPPPALRALMKVPLAHTLGSDRRKDGAPKLG